MSDLPQSPDQDPEQSSMQNPNPDPDPDPDLDLVLEIPDQIREEEPSNSRKVLPVELSHPEEVERVEEDEVEVPTPTSHAKSSRRGGGVGKKKAKNKRAAAEKKAQKKLETLAATLKPIPFSPDKTLDFSSHEKLLRRLGLWDFVHLEFDHNIRGDLLIQLIATYNQQSRGSYVNGVRVGVNRADLARALKLPSKKDKDKEKDRQNRVVDVELSKESVSFIEELVSNWFLLHEDTWIMPEEVMNWEKMIKAGQLEKVEWATLMWYMVEKELTASQLRDCYYASHMQCLIKSQREELLLQATEMEVDVKEDVKEDAREDEEGEHCEDVNLADREVKVVNVHNADREEDAREDEAGEHREDVNLADREVKAVNVQVSEPHLGPSIELSLGGQENERKVNDDENRVAGDDDLMDFELSKEKEHQQWFMDGKSNFSGSDQPFLRPCSYAEAGVVIGNNENKDGEEGCEDEEQDQEEEEEEEEEENDGQFHFSFKSEVFNGVTSTNFLDSMETAPLHFDTGLQIRSSGEFLGSGVETQMAPGSSSIFGNAAKRVAGNENDISHQPHDGNNKRLRTDEHWDGKDVVGFMEQAMNFMDKARMAYTAKEQAFGDLSMNQHLLVEELQRRERVIEHLQKRKVEEQQKRQLEVFRLEREIYMMAKLLDGYRKALKETNRAFSEYRARCPQLDEPLYKDVKGSGGLVLSSTELEKKRLELEEEDRMNRLLVERRLKQEEEDRMNRLLLERMIQDFEAEWIVKFEPHQSAVCLLGDRLTDSENKVKNLRELFRNSKVSDVPNETEFPDMSDEAKMLIDDGPDVKKVLDVPNMPDAPKVSDAPTKSDALHVAKTDPNES